MKVSFTFRHLHHSESLVTYGQDKIQKLFKFEMKPSWAEVVLSKQRHLKLVEIKVVGKNVRFVAKAEADDIFQALDIAIEKVAKQMHKKKSITQNHKLARRTKEFMLEQMSPSLDINYKYLYKKKAA